MSAKRISNDKQKCAVFNCPSTRQENSHRFPKSTIIVSQWIEATRNPRLLGLPYKQVHNDRNVICHLHFQPQDYQCSKRRKLKEGTIPSLLLPDKRESNSSSEEVDEKIDVKTKEDLSSRINITPPTTDFSPVTYRNWFPKSAESSSYRRSSSVAVVEFSDTVLPTTPKSTGCNFSRIESTNVLPGPSSSIYSQDESVHKVTKSGPCKRLVWERKGEST